MFLFHLSIRSLKKNFDDLQEIFHNIKNNRNIICLSETKIKNSPLNLSIPGYKFINVNSLTNAGDVDEYVSKAFHNEIITFDF